MTQTQVGGTNIVIIDHRSRRNWDMKLKESKFGPVNINNNNNNGMIFSLSRRMGYRPLFARRS